MSDISLRDEDVAILNLYREKWNHPSLEWSGEYRKNTTDAESESPMRLVVTVTGQVKADGKTYEASMYHSPKDWDLIGNEAIRSMCYYYPELIPIYFPGFEDYFIR